MMSVAKLVPVLSPDAYFLKEQQGEIKHEYINGYIYAMVGASRKHNLISTALLSALRQHLRGGPCRVYMSDMKVQIQTSESHRFYYPDVMVSCDANPVSEYYEANPLLIIEVLSASTEAKDRLEKLTSYMGILSLQEYMLVSQDKIAIDLYRRKDQRWILTSFKANETIMLTSVNCELPVDGIYEDVIGQIF